MSFSDVVSMMIGTANHLDRVKRISDPANNTTGIVDDSTASSKSYWERDNGPISAIVSVLDALLGIDTSTALDIVGELVVTPGVSVDVENNLNVGGDLDISGEAAFSSNVEFASAVSCLSNISALSYIINSGGLVEYDQLVNEVSSSYKKIVEPNDDYQMVFHRGHFDTADYSADTTGRQGSFLWKCVDDMLGMMLTRFGDLLVGNISETQTGGEHGYGPSGGIVIAGNDAVAMNKKIRMINYDTDSIVNTLTIGVNDSPTSVAFAPNIEFSHVRSPGSLGSYIKIKNGGDILATFQAGDDVTDLFNVNSPVELDSRLKVQDQSDANAFISLDASEEDGFPFIQIGNAIGNDFTLRFADDAVFMSAHAQVVCGGGMSWVDDPEDPSTTHFYASSHGKRAGFFLDLSTFPETGVYIGQADSTGGAAVLRLASSATSKAGIQMEDDTDGEFWIFSKSGVVKTTSGTIGNYGGTVLGGHRHQVVNVTSPNTADSATAKTEVAAACEEVEGNTVYAIDSASNCVIWVYSEEASDWIQATNITSGGGA